MFQPPRGTRDFLPEEMRRRSWVLDRFREVFEAYGYEPLWTPAFESWEMLKLKSGEEIIDQIYYFRDKSDRELGLRFEWTASLCRVVAAHRELTMPFKRYTIGPVWRYESPSEKRFREFWQADIDVVGVADPIADAEVLAASVDCLRRVGLEGFLIRLNDRRILEALVGASGLPRERSLEIFRAVDKLQKIGAEGVVEELLRIGAPRGAAEKLLQLTALEGDPDSVLDEVKGAIGGSDIGAAGCDALSAISRHSEAFGLRRYLQVDLSLARGLDYYTGPVYEVYSQGFEGRGSIAGGGRYDELIQLYGGDPTPATGVSLGVERIVPLLEERGAFDGLDLGARCYVAVVSDALRTKAVEVAQMLRRAGVETDLDLAGRSLARQLEHADRRGFRRVVIVGEREMGEGRVTVRDMRTGEQRTVPLDELTESV